MSTDHNQPDNELLGLLRTSLDALPGDDLPGDDPVPAALLEGAAWVHDWHNMEAELAQLTFDSTEDVELAGVRSNGALRELTFVTEIYTIEVEVEPGPRTVTVTGSIEPPATGTMQLLVGGEMFAGDIDEQGSFHLPNVAHGTVLAFIQTPAGKVRLGSFEV
jgi:hypothetical protein